jgi:hypothetical protein
MIAARVQDARYACPTGGFKDTPRAFDVYVEDVLEGCF